MSSKSSKINEEILEKYLKKHQFISDRQLKETKNNIIKNINKRVYKELGKYDEKTGVTNKQGEYIEIMLKHYRRGFRESSRDYQKRVSSERKKLLKKYKINTSPDIRKHLSFKGFGTPNNKKKISVSNKSKVSNNMSKLKTFALKSPKKFVNGVIDSFKLSKSKIYLTTPKGLFRNLKSKTEKDPEFKKKTFKGLIGAGILTLAIASGLTFDLINKNNNISNKPDIEYFEDSTSDTPSGSYTSKEDTKSTKSADNKSEKETDEAVIEPSATPTPTVSPTKAPVKSSSEAQKVSTTSNKDEIKETTTSSQTVTEEKTEETTQTVTQNNSEEKVQTSTSKAGTQAEVKTQTPTPKVKEENKSQSAEKVQSAKPQSNEKSSQENTQNESKTSQQANVQTESETAQLVQDATYSANEAARKIIKNINIDFNSTFKMSEGKFYETPEETGRHGNYSKHTLDYLKVNYVDVVDENGKMTQYNANSGLSISEIISQNPNSKISYHIGTTDNHVLGWNSENSNNIETYMIVGHIMELKSYISTENMEFLKSLDYKSISEENVQKITDIIKSAENIRNQDQSLDER